MQSCHIFFIVFNVNNKTANILSLICLLHVRYWCFNNVTWSIPLFLMKIVFLNKKRDWYKKFFWNIQKKSKEKFHHCDNILSYFYTVIICRTKNRTNAFKFFVVLTFDFALISMHRTYYMHRNLWKIYLKLTTFILKKYSEFHLIRYQRYYRDIILF